MPRPRLPRPICLTPGCQRESLTATGIQLCAACRHYARDHGGQFPTRPPGQRHAGGPQRRETPRLCETPRCGRPHAANGLCKSCDYWRARHGRRPTLPPGERQATPTPRPQRRRAKGRPAGQAGRIPPAQQPPAPLPPAEDLGLPVNWATSGLSPDQLTPAQQARFDIAVAAIRRHDQDAQAQPPDPPCDQCGRQPCPTETTCRRKRDQRRQADALKRRGAA